MTADLGESLVRVDDALVLEDEEPLPHLALGVQQGLVQVLLLAEVLFGALSLGDVAGYRRVANGVAGGVPDLGDGERDVDQPAALIHMHGLVGLDALLPPQLLEDL